MPPSAVEPLKRYLFATIVAQVAAIRTQIVSVIVDVAAIRTDITPVMTQVSFIRPDIALVVIAVSKIFPQIFPLRTHLLLFFQRSASIALS